MKLARSIPLLPAVAFALLLSPQQTRPAEPGARAAFEVPIGQRQLFLDDVGIERMDAVRRSVHPPKRHEDNPLLRPDTTWERGSRRSSASIPCRSVC